jgi:hypothetical protein
VDKYDYNQNNVFVRRSLIEDIPYIAENMKESDQKEVWASHNHSPEESLQGGFDDSEVCLTVLDGEKPVAMFGIVPEGSLLTSRAIIWLLSTEDLFKRTYRFLRHSRHYIDMFLDEYPYLYNYVHEDNRQSIMWLKFCGANINEREIHGVEDEYFKYFFFRR